MPALLKRRNHGGLAGRLFARIILILILSLSAGPAGAAEPDLAGFLPPESRVIFGLHLREESPSRLREALRERLAAYGASLDQFAAATGFDPRRDLVEIAAGGKDIQSRSEWLLVMRGRFDVPRIMELARLSGSAARFEGVDLIESKEAAVAFPADAIAIAGAADLVRDAIRGRRAGEGPGGAVQAEIAKLRPGRDAWFCFADASAALAGAGAPPPLQGAMQGEVIKTVQHVVAGIRLGDPVDLSAELLAGTGRDAQTLAVVIPFLAGMGRLHDDPALAGLFTRLAEGMAVRTEGNRVIVTVSLPEADILHLINRAQSDAPGDSAETAGQIQVR